jgi:hypothetical protein
MTDAERIAELEEQLRQRDVRSAELERLVGEMSKVIEAWKRGLRGLPLDRSSMPRKRPSPSLVLFVMATQALGACVHWVPLSYVELQARPEAVRRETVRVTQATGSEEIVVDGVDAGFIQGWSHQRLANVRLSITPPTTLEVSRIADGATTGAILGIIGGGFLALLGGFALILDGSR